VALYAILKAMGISSNDEVIVPGFTCVVVPNAIMYALAKPVYVDIDKKNYNIDVDKIEEKITKNTKAIIAQHTFGIPANMDRIVEICKRYKLYLIEDACHALGSTYKGKELGTIGDAAFFSSQWSKPVTTGLGGWAVVNNNALIEKMDSVYSKFLTPSKKEELLIELQYKVYKYFLTPKLFWIAQSLYRKASKMGLTIGSSTNEELEYTKPQGFEKKMGDLQRKKLEEKLRDKDKVIRHRKRITEVYRYYFPEEYESLTDKDSKTVFLRFPLLVKDKEDTLKKAKEKKIELGDWFLSPLHPNLTGLDKAYYTQGLCPIAEDVCNHIINLPTHEKITVTEAEKIATFVKNIRRM
jgi:dTDP-4-amino-4,6-dideoxygalactose transaminase